MFGIELTVGIVSSMIAAIIVTIQHTFPIFLGIVLAGVIQNNSTAATWSVITTILQNSNLHTILQSDSSSIINVSRPVQFLSFVTIFMVALVALCQVLTPLGIRQELEGRDVTIIKFEGVRDNDSFALGTAERKYYGVTRVCGVGEEACPGQEGNTTVVDEGQFQVAPWATEEPPTTWIDTVTSSSTPYTSSTSTSTSTSTATGTGSSFSFSSFSSASSSVVRSTATSDSSVSDPISGGTSSTSPRSSISAPGTTTRTSESSSGVPVTSNPPSTSSSTPSVRTSNTVPSVSPPAVTSDPPSSSSSSAAQPPTTPTPIVPTSNTPVSSAPPAAVTSAPPAAVTSAPPAAVTSASPAPVVPTANTGVGSAPAGAVAVQQIANSAAVNSVAVRSLSASSASDAYLALHRRSAPTPAVLGSRAAPNTKSLRRRASSKKYRVGSNVPDALNQTFSRASYYGRTVTNLFQIEFRNYILLRNPQNQLKDQSSYTIGQFRFLETLILSSGYKLIDGLIVDTDNGGIAFRRHASPDKETKRYGASWSESLLWMEPETACVANNISIELTTNEDGNAESALFDAGGFTTVQGATEPQLGADNGIPNLASRAFNGAFYFNAEIARALGVAGKGGPTFDFGNSSGSPWVDSLRDISSSLGDSQFVVHRVPLGSRIDQSGTQNSTKIDINCAGLTSDTPAGAPLVTCGLIVGAPRRTDASSSTLAGEYRYPLYTCATAIRASLQTTNFIANGTSSDLKTLTLINTTASSEYPIWGIERNNLKSWQISPLWGLIHPEDEGSTSLVTRRSQYQYLPAGQGGSGIADSLAGTGAYQYASYLMYNTSDLTPDYSGRTNYALYRRWETVTANSSTVALLPGLIWSDVMANLVTSTNNGGQGVKKVCVYRWAIKYDYKYAAPGFLLGVVWLSLCAMAVMFCLGRRVRFGAMRQLLNQVSTGRLVVNMLVEGSKESSLGSERWAKRVGKKVVGLECRADDNIEGWEREGDHLVSGQVIGFVDNPVEGRVLELLRKNK